MDCRIQWKQRGSSSLEHLAQVFFRQAEEPCPFHKHGCGISKAWYRKRDLRVQLQGVVELRRRRGVLPDNVPKQR